MKKDHKKIREKEREQREREREGGAEKKRRAGVKFNISVAFL